jgi:hypothetical protein
MCFKGCSEGSCSEGQVVKEALQMETVIVTWVIGVFGLVELVLIHIFLAKHLYHALFRGKDRLTRSGSSQT